MNSAVKLLDPARAGRAVVGIFHGPYHEPVSLAAQLLGFARAAVVQAPGGLPEPAPDKPTRVTFVDGEARLLTLTPQASAPPPPTETAEALAALNLQVLEAPAIAPPGAVRMAVLGAALLLWAAGDPRAPDDPALVDDAARTLHSGAAAHTRACYT